MARETVKIEGLEGVLKTLNELPAEVASKNGGPVRFALRKAAKIIQQEAQLNVQKIIDTPNKYGLSTKSIGLLKKSIIIKNRLMRNGFKGEAFFISIRGGRAYSKNQMFTPKSRGAGLRPKRKGPKTRQLFANDVGFMLERGTESRPPMPWIRPAFDAKKNEALTTFSVEINKKLASVIKKLERQNRVKT